MVNKVLLTVVVPAYNVEKTIKEALDSFNGINQKNIEVIVVNDGSNDRTREIVKKIASNNSAIRLINQQNGGHGSAINTGIKEAHGKYFRLLDGDDWFDRETFEAFLKKLEKEDADLVLTEHIDVFEKNKKVVQTSDYDNIKPNQGMMLQDIRFKKYGPTLPNTTVKTSVLRRAGIKIDEHCFYVDQEFDFIVYVFSKTVVKYDLPVYHYRLEQDNQSMAVDGLKKNVRSHERVCFWLLEHLKSVDVSKEKRLHLVDNVIVPLLNLQYTIAIQYAHSKNAFLSFDEKLKHYPEIYNHPGVAGSIIGLHRIMNGKTLFLDCILNRLGRMRFKR